MKKIVCIDDRFQDYDGPKVQKGKIYTVYDIWNKDSPLIYYFIVGMPSDWVFNSCMFIDLIEDQLDETEMVRKTEKT